MTKEIWKDIEGYEGKYQVSNKGRVKSLSYNKTGREDIMKQRKSTNGYLMANLCKNGKHKHCLIHRLVASAFIHNPEGLPEVNHKDEDKTNNNVENLEWCDHLYNNNYGTKNERSAKSQGKPVICIETNIIYFSVHEAQRKTGILASSICNCANHKKRCHTARRLHWQYV